jgi:serine/threonine protein kinase
VWTAGQKLQGYEIIAKLREGGMATLYLARLTGPAGFSRDVAIKVIHPSLANDEQFRQMFLDEAMLSSRIEHPNVVRVEELGQQHDAHFLVMEFVHGCSLSQLQRALIARKRRLAPAYAARIAMHVADGLHAAHELCDETGRLLNVVHRDVTPENVLLAYGGHVKLIDFGIAKAYGRKHRTQDGLLKGKFRYMAPEQALGKPVDRRVDIYQLGIVLWEMLTLQRLFAAERDIDLLASVQRPRIERPSTVVDRVPPALDDAVMAALDPDPRRRPTDAQAFSRLLARAVPAVHEVDAGALRELLLATMSEHRQRERATYPPGVYERLERYEPTLPIASAGAGGANAVSFATVEHTVRLGSDSPPAPSGRDSLVRTRSGRGRRGRKPVRLARFASELRTQLTQVIQSGFVGSRAYWVLIGSAIGLAGALALITLALRPRRVRVPALPPPLPPSLVVAQHPELPVEPAHLLVPVAESQADAGITATRPVRETPRAGRSAQKPTGARGKLIMVDGTLMLSKPGF